MNTYALISIVLFCLITKVIFYRYCITIFNDYENEKERNEVI